MPGEFFDSEERGPLLAALRNAYLARSGLTRDTFDAELGRIVAAMEAADFQRDRIPPDSVRNELLELVGEPIRLKAEELARASRKGGAGNLILFGALFVLLVIDPPFLERLPGFIRSIWVLVLVGGGVLVGGVHLIRGTRALARVRSPQALGGSSPVGGPSPVGGDVTVLTLSGRRSARNGPDAVPLLGAVGLAGVLGGVLVAGALPLVLGLAAIAGVGLLGLGAMRLVLLLSRRRTVRVTWSGMFSAWAAMIAWQLAVVAALVAVSGFRSGRAVPGLLQLGLGVAVAFGLARGASQLWALARRQMALSAEEVLAADQRPAMLYLRSFATDANPASYMYSPGFRRYDPFSVLSPADWIERRDLTFEEVVCRGLGRLGPVIAIGKPGEPLPRLGAARKYVEAAHWKEAVQRLESRCRLIAVLVGSSEGVLWEFEHLVERGDPRKVVLVIPQGLEYAAVWSDFVGHAAPRARRSRFPARLPGNTLAVAYRDDGGILLFNGPATAESYQEIGRTLLARLERG